MLSFCWGSRYKKSNIIWSHLTEKYPVSGCPKKLQADRVVCDTLLLIEIDELRSMSKQHARSGIIDFTELDEDN